MIFVIWLIGFAFNVHCGPTVNSEKNQYEGVEREMLAKFCFSETQVLYSR